MATIAEMVARARQRLIEAGVPADEAPGDAEVLARHALGWDLTRYATSRSERAPADFAAQFDRLLARRLTREPVSQIVGHREFWGLDFEVTRDVLTPRPETELVVQAALDAFPRERAIAIVDVGTGSGCIAVALATEFPRARLIASDVSLAALAVARRNAVRHGVSQRVAFVHSRLFNPGTDVDLIVSNPPYIATGDAPSLPPEVREYEPHVALFGGRDGLDAFRGLFTANRTALSASGEGRLIVEVGYDQAAAVRTLADPGVWTFERGYRDLQDIERVLVFRAKNR